MIRSFFRWIGYRLGLIRGSVDEINAELAKNPTLIRQEGRAIRESKRVDFENIRRIVSGKVRDRTIRENRIETDSKTLSLIAKAENGEIKTDGGRTTVEKLGFQYSNYKTAEGNAKRKMTEVGQKAGITDPESDQAKGDDEFSRHYEAFKRYRLLSAKVSEALDREKTRLQANIEEDRKIVYRLGSELINDRARLDVLDREIQDHDARVEGIVDRVVQAKQAKDRDDAMRGFDTHNSDSRMAALERIGQTANADLAVSEEMSGNPVDDEYLSHGDDSATVEEVRNLLNPHRGEAESLQSERESECLPNG